MKHGLLTALDQAISSSQPPRPQDDAQSPGSEDFSDEEEFPFSHTPLSGQTRTDDIDEEEEVPMTPVVHEDAGNALSGSVAESALPLSPRDDFQGDDEQPLFINRKRGVIALFDEEEDYDGGQNEIRGTLSPPGQFSHFGDSQRTEKRPRTESHFTEQEVISQNSVSLNSQEGDGLGFSPTNGQMQTSQDMQEMQEMEEAVTNSQEEEEPLAPIPLKPSEWMKMLTPTTPSGEKKGEIKRRGIDLLKGFSSRRSQDEPSAVALEDSTKQQKTTVRAVMDTASGRTCYINTRTGNSFYSLPLPSAPPTASAASPLGSDDESDSSQQGLRGLRPGQRPQRPGHLPLSATGTRPETDSAASVKKVIQEETCEGACHHSDHEAEEQDSGQGETGEKPAGESLETLFRDWKNPVFEFPPTQIPRLNHGNLSKFGKHFTPGYLPSSNTISKDLLAGIEVIGQVDNKFIACRTVKPPQMILFIDQHAADERIRLERLTKEVLSFSFFLFFFFWLLFSISHVRIVSGCGGARGHAGFTDREEEVCLQRGDRARC